MHGILCATEEELDALRARLDIDAQRTLHGPTAVWTGRHGEAEIVLARAGIGKVNAAAAATLLLSAYGATDLIFSGVAGGLDPELPVGSVLLADRLAIHDYGIMAGGRLTVTASGLMPIGAPEMTALALVPSAVAETLAALASAVQPQLEAVVRLGGIITADYFLNCVETRGTLRARLAADAIDMESGAVFQIAQAWGAPLYVIRTLSDLAGEESHTTYGEMVEMASHNSALCVSTLLALLDEASAPP